MDVDVSLSESIPDQSIRIGDDKLPEAADTDPPGNCVELPEGVDANDDRPDEDADNSLNGRGKCRRHRRGKNKAGQRHNKQWKPYHKLSWDERKRLEERETRRANQKREQRFASGQPMAPYNTTQFLMEQHQHDGEEFVLNENKPAKGDGSGSVDSSDEFYDSPEDEEIFMAKEFDEAYESVHAERLQNMSKDELVREYIEVESKVEKLEKQLKGSSPVNVNGTKSNGAERLSSEENREATTSVEDEIKKLREENARLLKENETLKAAKNTAMVQTDPSNGDYAEKV